LTSWRSLLYHFKWCLTPFIAIVPTLYDVNRYAIEVDAGAAGHECMLARK
jgi:hypothetical protein